jgi:hypothetical protein
MRLNRAVLIAAILLPVAALAEPLIDGASRRGPTFDAVEQAFRTRVIDAFPAGTTEADLIARLTDEGFTMIHGYAEVSRFGFPCRTIWRVLWNVNNGIVTDLDVVHGGVCL